MAPQQGVEETGDKAPDLALRWCYGAAAPAWVLWGPPVMWPGSQRPSSSRWDRPPGAWQRWSQRTLRALSSLLWDSHALRLTCPQDTGLQTHIRNSPLAGPSSPLCTPSRHTPSLGLCSQHTLAGPPLLPDCTPFPPTAVPAPSSLPWAHLGPQGAAGLLPTALSQDGVQRPW